VEIWGCGLEKFESKILTCREWKDGYSRALMMKTKLLLLIVCCLSVMGLSSCWPLLVGAGAAGGYMARDAGYEVQNPVTKE